MRSRVVTVFLGACMQGFLGKHVSVSHKSTIHGFGTQGQGSNPETLNPIPKHQFLIPEALNPKSGCLGSSPVECVWDQRPSGSISNPQMTFGICFARSCFF